GRTQKPRPLGDTFRSPGSSKFNPNKYHQDDLDPETANLSEKERLKRNTEEMRRAGSKRSRDDHYV
ncbi:MAG TPA: hypothetical protein VMX12_00110, partial [Acidimicrobiia bacterium]|nr:hypothetical protein [Acidimicrobiia bacterium]